LRDIYNHAIQAVNGQTRVSLYLQQHPIKSPFALIAIGKSAAHMAAGAFDIAQPFIHQALLITKQGYIDHALLKNRTITCLETGHPIPNEKSLEAGQYLLHFIQQLPKNLPVLGLISGGTSALVEVLPLGITLADLQRINQWALNHGLNIYQINQIRKNLSCIKAGRLAYYLRGHPVINLCISDVPHDNLQVIGSGLLTPHKALTLPSPLPDWLQTYLSYAPPLNQDFSHISQTIIATATMARKAAAQRAQQLGYPVFIYNTLLVNDALETGENIAHYLLTAKKGIHIWSGETTVNLPKNPGRGGRCQSLALAAALILAGRTDISLLAAGTDGNDGTHDVAGTYVDGDTILQGKNYGLNAKICLQQANAGHFLAVIDQLIHTGLTGTNVMDIIIALKK
jgi:hydroxypyruvate reductase